MTFNSYLFIIVFLPIVLICYYSLCYFKKYNATKIILIVASFVFYGYASMSYLWLLAGSVLFNYTFGLILCKTKKKILLAFGILVNLVLLYYFKYFNFTLICMNQVFKQELTLRNIILPLGISFFTFQQIAYLIDAYKEEHMQYPLIDYASYITFFPQLTAGPISLHDEMIPQFQSIENKKWNTENIAKGIVAFSFGLAKKVLLADTLAGVANIVFSNPQDTNAANVILGVLAYTFQIYFDFSGYCDMGMGVAKMLNITLPLNFDSPYQSLSITEFWRKWHMTLNRFFTKYIYIPLGGSRKGKLRTYFNIFLIFFISGIWHGANYTFILWGILQGMASIIERIWKETREKINPIFQWIITFSFINFSWLIFRSESISSAISMMKTIFKFQLGPIDNKIVEVFVLPESIFLTYIPMIGKYISSYPILLLLLFYLFCFIAVLCMKNTNQRLQDFRLNHKILLVSAFLFVWALVSISGVSTFIYVNF